MKVLFISSTRNGIISPLIQNQAKSLKTIRIKHFVINSTGFLSYFLHVAKLIKFKRNNHFDIYHAHFSYSAITAILAGCRPLIISLMGSDLNRSIIDLYFSKFLAKYFCRSGIVKSTQMKLKLNHSSAKIIPNGVNTKIFRPIPQKIAQEKIRWKLETKHILFAANPNRSEKNFNLAKAAFTKLTEKCENLELHCLINVPPDEVPFYLNAADVILLTSEYEGSPNVIKEAMACNRPTVCVDVGDVKENFENVKGMFIACHSPESISDELEKALLVKNSEGRSIILDDLSEDIVSKKLLDVYKNL